MDIVITEIEDAGAGLKITELVSGEIELRVTVTYNFSASFQKTWYNLKFTKEKFRYFQFCLKEGKKSWHGSSSLWQSNKIYIKKQNHPNNYRNIWAYRRFFILGFNLVPAALSQVIVGNILKVKV